MRNSEITFTGLGCIGLLIAIAVVVGGVIGLVILVARYVGGLT